MKQMKLIVIMLAVMTLVGCGKGDTGAVGAPGPTVYVPTPAVADPVSPEAMDIAAIVADENDYRLGLGQTALTNGLTCTLYTITGGQYIQNIVPTLTGVTQVATFLMKDSFNQADSPVSEGLNVLPAALRSNATYNNNIKLVCSGQLVVSETGYYNFELASDDASLLYLNGAKLIDGDGAHGVVTKAGTKYLRRGVHPFALHFAQTGGGNQALILNVNGALVPGTRFFH
jgi:hypothetical protein